MRRAEYTVHGMQNTQLSQGMSIIGVSKSGKQRHLEAGFWKREPEEWVCIIQSVQLFLNHNHCWKHTEVWLMCLRARASYPGPGGKLERARQPSCRRQVFLGRHSDKYSVMKTRTDVSFELKWFKLMNSAPESPTSKFNLGLARMQWRTSLKTESWVLELNMET